MSAQAIDSSPTCMVCYTDISSEEEQKVLNCCAQILHQQCYSDLLRKGISD